jgi:hypothetical protein
MLDFFKNYERLRKISLAASVVGIVVVAIIFMVASF